MGCPPVDPSIIDVAQAARRTEAFANQFIMWSMTDLAISAHADARALRSIVAHYWMRLACQFRTVRPTGLGA
jgi:hypothetical protein